MYLVPKTWQSNFETWLIFNFKNNSRSLSLPFLNCPLFNIHRNYKYNTFIWFTIVVSGSLVYLLQQNQLTCILLANNKYMIAKELFENFSFGILIVCSICVVTALVSQPSNCCLCIYFLCIVFFKNLLLILLHV